MKTEPTKLFKAGQHPERINQQTTKSSTKNSNNIPWYNSCSGFEPLTQSSAIIQTWLKNRNPALKQDQMPSVSNSISGFSTWSAVNCMLWATKKDDTTVLASGDTNSDIFETPGVNRWLSWVCHPEKIFSSQPFTRISMTHWAHLGPQNLLPVSQEKAHLVLKNNWNNFPIRSSTSYFFLICRTILSSPHKFNSYGPTTLHLWVRSP